jgi:aryl-alcohol dehydrogenase-like predicted oxidoreductase
MLTGKYREPSAFPAGDPRSQIPRFSAGNLPSNMRLIEEFEKLAQEKGCTPGQLSIAWVMAQGAIPIPGTRKSERMEENFGAGQVSLSQEDLRALRKIIEENQPRGER